MKKTMYGWSLAMVVLLLAACGTGETEETEETSGSAEEETEEVKVEHDLGETTVEKNPEDVVVFDFGSLDTLQELGVDDVAGVAKDSLPSYLSDYEGDEYENIGSLKEPDFEKIAEMAPELIVISGRQSDAYEELSKIAPTIYLAVDQEDYMPSFEENVNTLASIFEKEEAAEEKLADIEENAKNLEEKASETVENALVVLANEGKVSAYGSGSRFGIIHDVFGVPAVDEGIEASTHGESVSFEYITEQDPEHLFVVDRGAAIGGESSAKEVVENELTESTKAYKEDNITYLDPDYWYLSGGGLMSVSAMIDEVDEAISE